MTKYTIVRGLNKNPERNRILDNILADLEKNGRAITPHGAVSRYLAQRLTHAKDKEEIYFGWNKNGKKSLIVIDPRYKLKRRGPTSIELIYEETVQS